MSYVKDSTGQWRRTVTCSYCYEPGHNRSSCPSLKAELAKSITRFEEQLAEDIFADDDDRRQVLDRLNRSKAQQNKILNRGKNRKCSYCLDRGHNRRTCSVRKTDINSEAHKIMNVRKLMIPRFEDSGCGPGALIELKTIDAKELFVIEDIFWEFITHDYVFDKNKRWWGYQHRPVKARGCRPDPSSTIGRATNLSLPLCITNINDDSLETWQATHGDAPVSWKLVSPATNVSVPVDFADFSTCLCVASGRDKFNDGERPYEYIYPNG